MCEWNTNANPLSRTVCHRYTPKWKRATITLGSVASKQINYLWTMNIAYCSQNCCCLSVISQQIWFTGLDIHFHGTWILITFSTSAHGDGRRIQHRSWYLRHRRMKYLECMFFWGFFFFKKRGCGKLFEFQFLDMPYKHEPSTGHWKRVFYTLNPVMFMLLSSVANKQCFLRRHRIMLCPLFSPNIAFWCAHFTK